MTLLALRCAVSGSWLIWAASQLLLAICLLEWFVILHETGHGSFFASGRLNNLVGRVAGFLVLIPFASWRRVHSQHHKWTGWQDRDPTTATLVPRDLAPLEKRIIDLCWRTGLPLFSVLYRLNNFWNYPRLKRLFPIERTRRKLLTGIFSLALAYVLFISWWGPLTLLSSVGVGYFLFLAMSDPLILSQHTHVPMPVAGDSEVRPVPAADQAPYTRSLRVPAWFARLVLINFDAHEKHHIVPSVPGYYLHRIDLPVSDPQPWWQWLRAVKRIPAHVFLFSNRNKSGHAI